MRSRSAYSYPSMVLYALTLAAELPVLMVRLLLTLAVCALVLVISGHSASAAPSLMNLALIPTAWSVLALITPLGSGWWWRQHTGGREPSERERQAYQDAIEHLQTHNPHQPLRLPKSWFVIDTIEPDAAVCGDSLMLSRGAIENPYLPAVLAHELGHIATFDGRLTAALNRLLIHPPPRPPAQPKEDNDTTQTKAVMVTSDRVALGITLFGLLAWTIRKIIRFAKGGLGLRLTAPAWGVYWREREYTADQYAAQLGQAEDLADFLETHALIHDHPVPFIWLTEHSHPPTELRIDKLRNPTSTNQPRELPRAA